MKNNKNILITAFSIVTFAVTVGCKPADNRQPKVEESAPGSASAKLDDMKKETKEAAQATKEYVYAQKTEFVAAMKAEIAKLNQQTDELGTKIENSSAEAKEEGKAKLQALREKTTDLNKQLDSAQDADESTWDNVKAGFNKGLDETKDAFNQARQWLSEKIAP